jgi:LuxR family maltose regulon positive regulatory protein
VQILSTKLSIPPQRSRLVARTRLLQKLNQGLECGFILVSAPAGYGKSTLLSSWLSRLDRPAAWLALDDNDNDPGRFLSYLLAAFRILDPSISIEQAAPSEFDSAGQLEAVLSQVINHLTSRKQPCCLLLDDYHVIQDQAIHQAISFLLEHRPGLLTLVIATRADPPLPLARLRARSCLLELRMADLRFTLPETQDFLARTMGLQVSEGDADCLTRRTEGWIAGLQIAALTMQSSADISTFISTLSGSQHYIFDYLFEEILDRQSTEVQRFLLYTSVLEQLSAPLCDALLLGDETTSPQRPSSLILEELEHANLFIIPQDQEHRWYRYHPLFAELLRAYFKKKYPQHLNPMHTRASSWLEAHGFISEAIRHSIAAGDWEHIIALISANIFALLEQNELNTVARQMAVLTADNNPARPWLLVGRAWLAAYTGQLSTVEPILLEAQAEIDQLKSEAELQTLGGHIAAIRAYTHWIGNEREVAVQAARAALQWLPGSDYLIRCQAATLLGLSLDDFAEREKALKLALACAKECSISHVTIFAHGCWAWMLCLQGKLHESHAASMQAIQLAAASTSFQPLPTLSHVFSNLSTVLCEWNDLEGAVHYGREAVDLARRWEQADALHFALDSLGYALFAAGDVEGAYKTHEQAWNVASHTSTWFEQISIAQEIEWHLALGNLDAAIQRFRKTGVDIFNPFGKPLGSFSSPLLSLELAQIYLAQKDYKRAFELIGQLIDEMEKKKVNHYLIRLLLLQALAYQGMKQEDLALVPLNRALAIAIPEGYVRTFIGAGAALVPLLRQAIEIDLYPEYIRKLLTVMGQAPLPMAKITAQAQLIEPLSEREMEVLRLLAQGHSDKKIAGELVIARETVHKHLKNIYGKLDVHSRSEAIARAHELKLL